VVEIGMVIAQDPAIVLLDEPTAGMTSDETRLTGEIIKIISQDQSVVVISMTWSLSIDCPADCCAAPG